MDQVEDILCSNMKLLDSSHVTLQSIPLWMDASSFDTSSTARDNILPSPSPSYQDNGKSTLILTPSVFSTDPYPVIIAIEYPPPIMDTTLKPIQEMSKPTPSTLIQEFSEPKPSTHLGLNILPLQPSQITLSPLAFPLHMVKPIYSYQSILPQPNPHTFPIKHSPSPNMTRFHPYYPKPFREKKQICPPFSLPLSPSSFPPPSLTVSPVSNRKKRVTFVVEEDIPNIIP